MIHPAVAHDIEILLAGWTLIAVIGLIAWGVGVMLTEVRHLPSEGLHWRYTPEPSTCVVIDTTEQPAPVFFDQDVTA